MMIARGILMRVRHVSAAFAIGAGLAGLAAAPAGKAPGPPALADVLRAGAAYVAEFERTCASIVADEHYIQTDKPPGQGLVRRDLQADVVLFTVGGVWHEFRDVFAVDGRAVHARGPQLLDLLQQPRTDALKDAARVADDSAHYDLGSITRAINLPMLALFTLRADAQQHFTFALQGEKIDRGTPVAVVQFRETGQARMIQTEDRAAAQGRVWLETASGRVRRTELAMHTGDATIQVTVAYGPLPGVSVWVPATLDEAYEVGARSSGRTNAQVLQSDGQYGSMQINGVPETLTGHKSYDRIRLGLVDTSRIR